jgi:hypothetical protein
VHKTEAILGHVILTKHLGPFNESVPELSFDSLKTDLRNYTQKRKRPQNEASTLHLKINQLTDSPYSSKIASVTAKSKHAKLFCHLVVDFACSRIF